jgi:hypothetical protein
MAKKITPKALELLAKLQTEIEGTGILKPKGKPRGRAMPVQVLDKGRFVGLTLTKAQEEELDRRVASEGKAQAQVLRELLDQAMGIDSATLPPEMATKQQPGRKKKHG